MQESWKYDMIAETDGVIAVLPFGEIKTEIRRQPKAVSDPSYSSSIASENNRNRSQARVRDNLFQLSWAALESCDQVLASPNYP